METHVISVRLPHALDGYLRASARNAHLSTAEALDWLLRNSFGNFELLRGLAECREQQDSKLDVRIPNGTFEQLKEVAERLGISISVYVRRLLFHFFVTKRIRYVKSDGRYTLAGQP